MKRLMNWRNFAGSDCKLLLGKDEEFVENMGKCACFGFFLTSGIIVRNFHGFVLFER